MESAFRSGQIRRGQIVQSVTRSGQRAPLASCSGQFHGAPRTGGDYVPIAVLDVGCGRQP
jgi:hypothetical protein